MEKWILFGMAPVFLGLIALEAWYWHRRRPGMYSGIDTLSNAALALMHQVADAIAWLVVIGVYYAVYRYRLFDLPAASVWTIAALFLAQDFFYYWFHRASHRIRWLWASHVTHHSSERLNLSTAFRQSLTYPISGMWLFWLPLAWLGFEPTHIVAVVAINLGFQFFVHTQAVGRLGWLEYVFNTPSHHRVHHARNREVHRPQLRRRADRVGQAVRQLRRGRPDGAVRIRHRRPGCAGNGSHNPIRLTFHEWVAMFRDAARARGWRAAIWQLFCPPERASSHLRADASADTSPG